MNKVLVVDDVRANRNLLRRMLELKGHAVVEAADGEEGIKLFREEKPDLILMDINMPGVDGYEATSRIKKLARDNYVPVIFVTAMKAETSLADALASGGDDFISKPVDMEMLQSKIQAHLRIRDLNRQLEEKNRKLMEHNAYLLREQELIEYFFDNALQQSFLHPSFIKYHISPLSAFNGDLLLAERGPSGALYLVLGDFTGHGLAAAMGTLPVAQVFFDHARGGAAVGDIARTINHQLVRLMPLGMFFAATLLEISPSGERVSLWAGGLPEAYLLDGDGTIRMAVRSQHMPLGILDAAEFDGAIQTLTVSKNEKLYLYTDGVIETAGEGGELFGSDRLTSLLSAHGDERFERVLEALKRFRGERGQEDDVTFVEVDCSAVAGLASCGEAGDDWGEAGMPLEFVVPLSAPHIRGLDPVQRLADALGTQPALAQHKSVIQTLLSEMYTNAVEHGVLGLDGSKKIDEEGFVDYYRERDAALRGLDEAHISIAVRFDPDAGGGRLHLRLTDSGGGFNGRGSKRNDEALHGRGLGIVAALCESVDYSDAGRTVEVVYRLGDS